MEINRKDCNPEVTIEKAKEILNRAGLNTIERSWHSYDNNWYSVRLELSDFPIGIGTNGKGITKNYALASAYGELMERIQNRAVISSRFSNKSFSDIVFYDEKIVDIDYIYQDKIFNEIFTRDEIVNLTDVISRDNYFRIFAPFYNVNGKVIEYLPIRLIKILTGTNGYCAGNSPEEAIVQGLCEILERYVHKLIFTDNIKLPTIPIEEFSKYNTYEMLQSLKSKGYTPIIKDCSLEGKYPVIGMILLDPSKTKYHFTIGSDTNIDIALQRCITEMFQGLDFDSKFPMEHMFPIEWHNFFEQDDKDLNNLNNYYEYIKSFYSNSGNHPASIFFNKTVHISDLPFINRNHNNKDAYKYLVRQITNYGYDIFVRNNSYLGFSTYIVYIPGMSEVFKPTKERLIAIVDRNENGNTLFNIQGSNQTQINKLIDYMDRMENIIDMTNYRKGECINILTKTIILNRDSYFNNIDHQYLKSILCHKIGDQKKELIAISNYLTEMTKVGQRFNNNNFYIGQFIYLYLKIKGISKSEIINIMEEYVGKDIILKIMLYYSSENKLIDQLPLPICPNCKICKIQDECYFDSWEKINNYLKYNDKLFRDVENQLYLYNDL